MKKRGHIWIIHEKNEDELAKKGYQDLLNVIKEGD